MAPEFLNIFESMPDGIIMVDPEGRIAFSNSQAERLFGYDSGQLTGQSVEVLLPAHFRAAHSGYRSAYITQPRNRAMGVGLDLYGQRRDGSAFPVEISLSPLKTEGGPLVISAIRDITERKRIEARLQEASRMKSEFLANMSHELRTPLNGIIGFSELLVDEKVGTLSARQKDFMTDVLNSGRHLLRLINDVLDLAKVEAGRMELFCEAFSVAAAIEEACTLVSPLTGAKRIQVNQAVAPDVGTVVLDALKFKQVLHNLLSNAAKFTDDGGRIDIAASIRPDGALRIDVRDTGIGIDPADFDKLFVEF
jgi:PAS domain S-box-containing protein